MLSRKPSEYFRENIYMTFQDDRVAFQCIDMLEVDRLMWACDHPALRRHVAALAGDPERQPGHRLSGAQQIADRA